MTNWTNYFLEDKSDKKNKYTSEILYIEIVLNFSFKICYKGVYVYNTSS